MMRDESDDTPEAQLEREREIVNGIERGLADMRAGRVVSQDEAMRSVRVLIERASRRKKPD